MPRQLRTEPERYPKSKPALLVSTSVDKPKLRAFAQFASLAGMTELLENALRKLETLPKEEQDAIASQIIDTLEDEAAWREKLGRNPEKLRRLAQEAREEHRQGETRPLEDIL